MKTLRNEESGLISIAVTIIITALLTLMAVGFAGLSSREYRQALDQQLNSQAFYAAESGVNEAIANPSSFSQNCTEGDVCQAPTLTNILS